MNGPDLVLRGERDWSSAAEYTIHLSITSHIELTTRPDRHGRTFTMRATRVRLSWSWRHGEWQAGWAVFGHRWRKTEGDWSPHERGYMSEHDIDMPDWLAPLIDANAPTMQPTVGGGS